MSRGEPTLQAYFWEGDNNLRDRLVAWLGEQPPKQPWTLRVTFTASGSATREIGVYQAADSVPAQVIPLLMRVETDVANANLGPAGTIQSRAWSKGGAEAPAVNFSRVIRPVVSEGLGEMSTAWKQFATHSTSQTSLSNELIVQVLIGNMELLKEAHKTIMQLGTARTQASVVADGTSGLGGLWQVLGLAALVVGWPAIKKSLGLPDSAGPTEIMTMAQARLLQIQADLAGKPPAAPMIPAGAGPSKDDDELEVKLEAEAGAEASLSPSPEAPPATFDIGALLGNPDAVAKLRAQVMSDPVLLQQAMQLFGGPS